MLDRSTYGSSTSPLIVRHADGSTEGKNPQQLTPTELAAVGHTSQPIFKVIRAKCLDCSGGSRSEAAACTAVACALWPYRLGANPFAKPRGRAYTGSEHSSEKLPQTAEVSGGNPGSSADGGAS